ncbi:MAG: SDR family oxidoreductase [Leucobacter sp.]
MALKCELLWGATWPGITDLADPQSSTRVIPEVTERVGTPTSASPRSHCQRGVSTLVETPLGKHAWAGEKGERVRMQIPTGRFAQPEEVATLIGFLAGEHAAMMTSSNYLIDGGYTLV